MEKNRYIGEYPVIGIRPIIDGRRGPMQLRESLEDQVMAMAEAAKKLFEENLYYSNGEPVKVVMADTSIGRVPESAACAEKFKREGVAITLSVTPCWCYGSETMDMDPMTIKGVWGFNGTERPGAVYLASVLATHAQKGLPAFGIYGHEVPGPRPGHGNPRRREGKAAALRPCRCRSRDDAGQELSADRLRHHGHRRLHHGSELHGGVSGPARGVR